MTFHSIITNTNFCIGLYLNIVLIYIIRKCQKTRIRQYRHVLLMLTIFNLIYSFQHTFIAPKFYDMDYSAVIWVEKTVVFGFDISDLNAALFLVIFFLSLLVQAYHFIYRFVQICYPNKSYIFEEKWFLALACGFFLLVTAGWFWFWMVLVGRHDAATKILDPIFRRDINRSSYEVGYSGPTYKIPDANGTLQWSPPDVAAWLVVVLDISLTFVLIAYTGLRMVLALRTSTMSKKTLDLQKALLKLLAVQTIAPVCFSYFPPFISFTSAMFKSSVSINFTVDMPTFYPVMEPLIFVYFVEDYMIYVKSMFRYRIKPSLPYNNTKSSEAEKTVNGIANLKTHTIAQRLSSS